MDFFKNLLGKKEEPQSNSLYPSQSATPQPGIFSNLLNKLNPVDPKTGGKKKKPKKTKKTKKPKKQTKYKRN